MATGADDDRGEIGGEAAASDDIEAAEEPAAAAAAEEPEPAAAAGEPVPAAAPEGFEPKALAWDSDSVAEAAEYQPAGRAEAAEVAEPAEVEPAAWVADERDSLQTALAGWGGHDIEALVEAQAELERTLLADMPGEAAEEEGRVGSGNIVGLGIGEKTIGGVPTSRVAIKVFVKEKLPPEEVVPESLVPRAVDGVPTDVEAVGEIVAGRFTQRYRPAPGGVSIGNCKTTMAGTLGCLVRRGTELFLLSNCHVLAPVEIGETGDWISQPGRLDGGVCPDDVVARLAFMIPIVFGGTPNSVDAAIAATLPSRVEREILRPVSVRQPLTAPEMAPVLNQQVQKSGRTTQYRRGIIDAVNVTIDVSYEPFGGVARFRRQFRVRGIGVPFGDRGDSGSLVTMFPDNNPVGLLFAVNTNRNVAFCNPIRSVLAALGVSIEY